MEMKKIVDSFEIKGFSPDVLMDIMPEEALQHSKLFIQRSPRNPQRFFTNDSPL
jgi:hypothetical protein